MLSVSPLPGGVPANVTTPSVGETTAAPAAPATSIPRCCPAATAARDRTTKGRSTGPSTGHVHASARARSGKRDEQPRRARNRAKHRLLSDEVNDAAQGSEGAGRCQRGLQGRVEEHVARRARQSRDDGRPPAVAARRRRPARRLRRRAAAPSTTASTARARARSRPSAARRTSSAAPLPCRARPPRTPS